MAQPSLDHMIDKEIPLLYTPDNRAGVRAGIKTETRRAMKPQPTPVETVDTERGVIVTHSDKLKLPKNPYGYPQSEPVRYWMREPVQVLKIRNQDEGYFAAVRYLDGGVDGVRLTQDNYYTLMARKNYRRPTTSLHMLKVFTRTWLRGVRVWPEQLGKITADGAIAEGIELDPDMVVDANDPRERQQWENSQVWRDYINGGYELTPTQSYASLWTSIHGHWTPEQWVWVIQFEKEIKGSHD